MDKKLKALKSFLKPKNLPRVALLLFILVVLYYFYSNYLKEGFEATHKNIDQYLTGEQPTLVLFYANWCGHCKKLKPTWEEATKKAKESDLTMVQIDVGGNDNDSEETKKKNAEITKKYNINGYPTIMLFSNGTQTPYEGPRTVDGFIGAFN
jgi:thiol-disulfide isomerase/thioredoxin